MKINKSFYLLLAVPALVLATLLTNCSNPETRKPRLPILGERQVVQRTKAGQTVADTLYPRIPDFRFVDQDSQQVTNQTFAGKIYIADFFFTSCPTICPKMRTQLLRVYGKYQDNARVMLLSHTIDPRHDSVAVLKEYAQSMGVNTWKWHFVTGEKDSVYAVAQRYLVSAIKDSDSASGVVHSGAFVLVDANRHVRGIYDGTDPVQVDRLLQEIPVLLRENQEI